MDIKGTFSSSTKSLIKGIKQDLMRTYMSNVFRIIVNILNNTFYDFIHNRSTTNINKEAYYTTTILRMTLIFM